MQAEPQTVDRQVRGWQTPLVLSLLITFFVYCDAFLNHSSLPWESSSSGFHFFLIWIGSFFAQPILLAAWAVLGAEPKFVRLPRAVFLVCLLALAVTFGTWLNKGGRLDGAEVTDTLVPVMEFLAAAVVFRIVKAIWGWQIVRPIQTTDDSAREGSQFSLWQLLTWQSLTAIVVVASTMLFRGSDLAAKSADLIAELADSLGVGLTFGSLTLPAVPLFGLVLGIANRLRFAVTALSISSCQFVVLLTIAKLSTGKLDSEDLVSSAVVFISFHLAIAASLLVARLLGYRLIGSSISPQALSAEQTAGQLQPTTKRALLISAALLLLALSTVPLFQELQVARVDSHRELEKFYLGVRLSTRADGTQVDFYPTQAVQNDALTYAIQEPNVSCLRFTSSGILDEQLAVLSKFKKLKTLFLDSTPITDEGLKHLERLEQLTALYLTNSFVTSEGVQQLQQALPDCAIIYAPNNSP